jgi:hypothetical protein
MNGTRDLGTLGGLRDKFCSPLAPLWGTHSRGSRDVSGALVFKGLALPPLASCIGDGRKTMVKYLSCLPSIMDCSEELKKLVLDDLKKVGFIRCGDNATTAERVFFPSTTDLDRHRRPVLGLHCPYLGDGNPGLAVVGHAGSRELVPGAYMDIELDATRSSELLISEAMHHGRL